MPGSPTAAQFLPAAGQEMTAPAMTGMAREPHATQLEASTSRQPSRGSALGLILAAVGVVLLLAGGAAALVLLRAKSPAALPPSDSAQAGPANEPSAAPSAEPVASAAPSASAPAEAEAEVSPAQTALLSVETVPAGATVYKGEFQVCDTTPCEVTAALNETVVLKAKKGALSGKAKVLAQRDQRVKIALKAPVVHRPPPKMCEVEVDGIKILRECP
jgi:hypothetical protein